MVSSVSGGLIKTFIMTANKIVFVAFSLYELSLVLTNSGIPCSKSSEGVLGCIPFGSNNEDSQWAVCATEREYYVGNQGYECDGSHCWLTCTVITQRREIDSISEECKCNKPNWLLKTEQLLDSKCYYPIKQSEGCSWFKDCLYKICKEPSNIFDDSFGIKWCDIFESNSDKLSTNGNDYISSVKQCLQRELYHLILPSSNQTCTIQENNILEAHKRCLKSESLKNLFCSLPVDDQSNIFWTTRSLITDAFGSSARSMLDSLRGCYTGNARSTEKQIVITANSINGNNVQSTVDSFAQSLGLPFMDIVWDSQDLPQVSESIKAANVIFKPKFDHDFTMTGYPPSNVDMNGMMEKIKTETWKNSLNILQVKLIEDKVSLYRSLGECPVYEGYGGLFDIFYPQELNKLKVHFVLYKREFSDSQTETLDYFNDDSITDSSYNGGLKTYYITHGFSSYGEKKWVKDMASALLEKEDCNVIVVDWREGAKLRLVDIYLFPVYATNIVLGALTATIKSAIQAGVNTQLLGCFIGKMLEKIKTLKGTEYADVHLIGHSFGAQTSGFAGSYVNGQIGRITGIDPAGPGFKTVDKNFRLDKSDAVFVDVIHTDTMFFGLKKRSGHVDFYPNGGEHQPGCNLIGCSHIKGQPLFTETIASSCNFWACDCSDENYEGGRCRVGQTCIKMGFSMDTSVRGSYYLKTNKKSPLCTGNYPDRKRKRSLISIEHEY